MAMGTRRTAAVAVLAVLLAAACGSDDDEPAADETTTTTTVESTTTTVEPDVIDDRFDVGDGRLLHLRCKGTGSPTILLEAGDESGMEDWSLVDGDLEAETRTCAYDRAGNGSSSPAAGCRGIDDLVGDLEALLDVAGVDGPYLPVGASGGGYLMVEFASRHAEDTDGLVLVETPKAISDPAPPPLDELLKCDAPTNIERRDYVSVENDAWGGRHEIGDIPVTIITNDYGPDATEPGEATNATDQEGWLVLSPQATQVIVTSGHDVPYDDADLVVEKILKVLDVARAG
jgi:pimeloyl-ACP methyl ester carboxylesterase